MSTIIMLRHAHAGPDKRVDDQGRAQIEAILSVLRDVVGESKAGLVLVSPQIRSQETGRRIAREFGWEVCVRFELDTIEGDATGTLATDVMNHLFVKQVFADMKAKRQADPSLSVGAALLVAKGGIRYMMIKTEVLLDMALDLAMDSPEPPEVIVMIAHENTVMSFVWEVGDADYDPDNLGGEFRYAEGAVIGLKFEEGNVAVCVEQNLRNPWHDKGVA